MDISYNTGLLIFLFILINVVLIPLVFNSGTEALPSTDAPKKSLFEVIKEKLTGSAPIEEEHTILLNDDFDGIRELDNKVPPWFNILFYGTIVIAVIYMFYFHVFNIGKLPAQEYADEMFEAKLQRDEMIRTGAFINENNVVLLNDPESIAKGKQTFLTNCIACHGNYGEGTVGPNLTDEFWIHGGGVKNVFKTVKYGVPVKGMISWQTQFNPKTIQQVVSYVLSLQGSKPPNGKMPEGEKYFETDSTQKSNNLRQDSLIANTKDTLNKKMK